MANEVLRWLVGFLILAPAAAQTPQRVEGRCRLEDVALLGLACSPEDPCPLYLEISDVTGLGNRLFAAGNIHSDSATLESILLVSEDAGLTWTEAHARIPLAGLEQIQFADFESGWVAGHILRNQPTDPFLLMTTDGGKTWRRKTLSGEPRPGSIGRYWFDARKTGLLVVDRLAGAENGMRHELYESVTGGESWSLKQVSDKPIAVKQPPPVEPAWRVRADPSKTYVIERISGSRWQAVASFLIAAGECKPPAAAPPEKESAQP